MYLEITVTVCLEIFFLPIFNGKRGKYDREIKVRGSNS